MLYELLKPKLPLLIHSFGISLALIIIKTKSIQVQVDKVLKLTVAIFSTLTVLTSYAPNILPATRQGMGFNAGLSMVGGGSACPCDNPYTNDSLMSVIRDQVDKLPSQTKTLLSLHPQTKELLKPALIRQTDPLLPQGAQTEIITEPKEIMVKVVKGVSALNLCKALENAGYDPKWTMTEIEALKSHKKGRKALAKIDRLTRAATGMGMITNNDLIKCYPHYYTDYVCKKLPAGQKQHAMVNKIFAPAEEAESAHEIAKSIPKTKPSRIKPKTPSLFPGSVKHCHWGSLKRDLDQSITESIQGDLSLVEEQKLITTLYYLKQRTELEIRNLINLFQSKTKIEWLQFFRSSVEREPRGYHIEGTTYYIPWDLFRKYDVCFGR